MQLRNSLYTIVGVDTGSGTFTLRLLPECFIYQAHFPGRPVTPGVCIVQMGVELIEEFTGRRLRLVRIKNVKFLSPLVPDEEELVTAILHSSLSTLHSNDSVEAKITLQVADEVKAKLSIACEPEE